MSRLALPALLLLPPPALAHGGLHHHPHGIEFGWLAAAAIGAIAGGGAVLALLRGRR